MRLLGLLLVVGGILYFIFETASPGLLPNVPQGTALAVLALGGGILLIWVDELGRQKRRWKGVKKQQKQYYD